ncbi:MAG: penicillin-binding protein 2 [Coriobacteriia bacterium]
MKDFRQDLRPRLVSLGFVVLAILGLLLVRLWTIQVLEGPSYAKQAEGNRLREVTTEATRGRILDRRGRELVTNRPTMAVVVAPKALEDARLIARLSELLGIPTSDIRERISSVKLAPLSPRTIATDVSMPAVAYISENATEFPGVEVRMQAVREYPQGQLAAHLLGYTGEVSESDLASSDSLYQYGDIVGKTGAENSFERVLQGDRGRQLVEVDSMGRARKMVSESAPVAGSDVVLTIDSEVQAVAEKALAQAMDDARKDGYPKAKAGAAIAIEVKTGEVIAMASLPTYSPEVFMGGISPKNWKALTTKESEFPLTNRAIMGQYPAASTFKAMTGLAGLEAGFTTPGSTYPCRGRWTGMGEQWEKYCWDRYPGHGTETFMDGIRDSCDVVFYEIGYRFYKDKGEKLQKFSRRYGFGVKSGIDLPGETAGRIPDAAWKASYNEDYPEYQRWLPGDTVNLAIGQGDNLVTPLQLVNAYAGIANGGKVMKPHVLKQVLNGKGSPVLEVRPEVAFDSKTSSRDLSTMKAALVSVTEVGTGKGAFAGFPVMVAGKTGTAQIAGKDNMALFAGFAPAGKPRYCVVVVIEQGGGGGAVAAPAARQILAACLGQKIEHVKATDASR